MSVSKEQIIKQVKETLGEKYYEGEKTDFTAENIIDFINLAHQSGIEEGAEAERKRIKTNIGFLRQWLNEKPEKMLVTNEDIEEWLFNFEPLRGKNEKASK